VSGEAAAERSGPGVSPRLRIDPRPFAVVSVPVRHEARVRRVLASVLAPFFVQLCGEDLHVVVAADEWARVRALVPGAREAGRYRLITLEAPPDRPVVDVLAVVRKALAEAGVPARVLVSFHRDHLLVDDASLPTAVAALRRLADATAAPAVATDPAGGPADSAGGPPDPAGGPADAAGGSRDASVGR
jgi:hypothetical protein